MKSILVLLLLCPARLALAAQDSKADETAIRKIVQEQVTAWNASDAVAYSRHFAEDGTFTNIRGEFYRGYEPFLKRHEAILKSMFHGSTLKVEVVSLRFVHPGVAIVELLNDVVGYNNLPLGTSADSSGHLQTRLLQVMVKRGNDWKILAYHNVDVKKPDANTAATRREP